MLTAATTPLDYALKQAEFRYIDTASSHATLFHWLRMSFPTLAVCMLRVLGALRPAAQRQAAWTGRLALTATGAAALVLGSYASALGAHWTRAALMGSGGIIHVAEWEAQGPTPGRERNAPPGRS